MSVFSSSEFFIFDEFINLVVEECLEKILEYHTDSDGMSLSRRYETKDFSAHFRMSVSSTVRTKLDCVLEGPELIANPEVFDSIESLAEHIAVHSYRAHGKDGFEVNTCPSCGSFMDIDMKEEYYNS